nr:hypothetical protein [Tanacetum cinerariifolium]
MKFEKATSDLEDGLRRFEDIISNILHELDGIEFSLDPIEKQTGDEIIGYFSKETKSDEFLKSSVENLVPSPSESEDECECDVPACDDFATFSNLLFDAEDDFSSRIDEADCDLEEEIRLIEKFCMIIHLLVPRKNLFLKILMLQSNLSLHLLSPLRIVALLWDILEELFSNDSLSPPKNKSFHIDIPSSPRPPAKPPDNDEIEPNSGILTVKVCGNSLSELFCHQCTCEFCGNGVHVGYNCPAQVPSIQTLPSFPQQYPCCEDYRDLPEAYQCQPPHYTVNHPIFNAHNDLLHSQKKLMEQLTSMYEFIKSSVESLVLIPSESEGIPDSMCDVPFHDNSPPLDVSKDQFKDFSESNDESTSTNDDSFSIDNIKYVEASPPNFELISSEVMEIVIPEVGGIDDDILLTIKDDILREKLLNINLLIASIEALNDNPAPFSDFMTKSSSTSLNSLLEETNTFDNSLPEFETFCFDLEEISSGSTTTHSDSSLCDSFIFDLSINPFPHTHRSDFYEFSDELTHIISPPEYDCFYFKIEPNSGDFTMDVVEDTFPTKEPRVHNALPTHPTFQLNLDFILSSEFLFAYVVWIFLFFLLYSVAPQYLLSLGNEDTIFDPGICGYHISSFLLDVSHRSGTFIKFKVLNESPMEILFSTCSPMDQ